MTNRTNFFPKLIRQYCSNWSGQSSDQLRPVSARRLQHVPSVREPCRGKQGPCFGYQSSLLAPPPRDNIDHAAQAQWKQQQRFMCSGHSAPSSVFKASVQRKHFYLSQNIVLFFHFTTAVRRAAYKACRKRVIFLRKETTAVFTDCDVVLNLSGLFFL